MEVPRAGLENGVDVAAAVASLRGIVEAGLNFEFLDYIRAGQGRVSEFRNVVVSGADSFDQVVVVVFALAIDLDANVATAERGGGVQFGIGSGREGQQLLKVLGGEREVADGAGFDALAGRGRGGIYALHQGLDLDLFKNLKGSHPGIHAGGLGNPHGDIGKLRFLKSAAVNRDGVGADR